MDTMPTRRRLLQVGTAVAASPAMAAPERVGRLVIIGGAEDRLHDKLILRKFVSLCGGPSSRIRVLCAASSEPEQSWATYQRAFGELGVVDCQLIPMAHKDAANSPAVTDLILQADGVFIAGGDQSRLMDMLGETQAFKALHVAFHLRGCCIGGTSAGAAVMSRHMLASGQAAKLPEKDMAELDLGLGFVSRAVVDQHFSERGRLGRLLSVLAQWPQMLGVGIDEDTALVIERNVAIEVIGSGAVTLIDGRAMLTNVNLIESRDRLEMLGVRIHLLPAGHRYSAHPLVQKAKNMPPALREAIALLVAPGPIRQ
jgi:cyanophycinase